MPLHIFLVMVAGQVPNPDLRSELRQSMRKLEEMYSQVQIEGVLDFQGRLSKTENREAMSTTAKMTFRFASADGRRRSVILPQPRQGRSREDPNSLAEIVFITDLDRAYQLRRKLRSDDYVAFYAGKAPQPSWVQDFHENAFARAPFTVAATPLSQLLDAPDFAINRVVNEVRGGRRLTRVDFDKSPPTKQGTALSGWFLLDSENGWVVREFEVQIKPFENPGFLAVNRATVQYDEISPARAKSPVLVTFSIDRPNDGHVEVYRFQPERIVFAPLRPGEFTPAAFGLGDAMSTADSTSALPLHWAAFGAAFILLCLRISLVAIKKRLRHE